MTFSSRLDDAIKLAARLHRDQVRNDNEKSPYITHLVSVMVVLSQVTDDEDILVAGIMHDSLEDVPHYTYEQLVEDCGERVAKIVHHVTEPLDASKLPTEQLPWLERKEKYLETLQEGGWESALVSCADKIHNTQSFLKDAQLEGNAFIDRFRSSIRNRLWFHNEVYTIVKEKLGEDHVLVVQLHELLKRSEKTFLSEGGI
jgi:(p)ppGpp synthase/HD superfamily hydrolase